MLWCFVTDAATSNCSPPRRCPACKRGHPENSSRGIPGWDRPAGDDYASRSPSFEITRESSAPTVWACRLTAYIAQFRRVGESFGGSPVLAQPNRTIRVAYPGLFGEVVRDRCSLCAAGPNEASIRIGRVVATAGRSLERASSVDADRLDGYGEIGLAVALSVGVVLTACCDLVQRAHAVRIDGAENGVVRRQL